MSLEKFITKVLNVKADGIQKMTSIEYDVEAIHSQESKAVAREKAALVAEELRELKLTAAAKKVEEGIEETLTYMDYPSEHWNRTRTNNTTERVNREIKRRTKAIGAFPDGRAL